MLTIVPSELQQHGQAADKLYPFEKIAFLFREHTSRLKIGHLRRVKYQAECLVQNAARAVVDVPNLWEGFENGKHPFSTDKLRVGAGSCVPWLTVSVDLVIP